MRSRTWTAIPGAPPRRRRGCSKGSLPTPSPPAGRGVVEWAWNINPFSPIENEAMIGLFRPDGTAKPELRALPALAAFFREAAALPRRLRARSRGARDPALAPLRGSSGRGRRHASAWCACSPSASASSPPHSPSCVSPPSACAGAKLVLVPVPEMLGEDAARALLEASRAGTRVLVTGAVEGDPYGRVPEPLRALGIVDAGRPVALHEATRWGATGGEAWLAFEGLAQEWLRRSGKPEPARLVGNDLARAAAPGVRPGGGAARRPAWSRPGGGGSGGERLQHPRGRASPRRSAGGPRRVRQRDAGSGPKARPRRRARLRDPRGAPEGAPRPLRAGHGAGGRGDAGRAGHIRALTRAVIQSTSAEFPWMTRRYQSAVSFGMRRWVG